MAGSSGPVKGSKLTHKSNQASSADGHAGVRLQVPLGHGEGGKQKLSSQNSGPGNQVDGSGYILLHSPPHCCMERLAVYTAVGISDRLWELPTSP